MKKLMFGVSCAAIAFAGVWGVSESKSEELANNDLLMENVEALTRGEIDDANDESECKNKAIYGEEHLFVLMVVLKL